MQVVLQRKVEHPRERLNEEQREESGAAGQSDDSPPLRTVRVAPGGPRSSALLETEFATVSSASDIMTLS